MYKYLRIASWFHAQRWLGALLLSMCWFVGYGAPGDIKVEAESATLNGVEIVTTTPGYSGTGYAWNFDSSTGSDNVSFSVPATAGEYDLTIVYYSPYGEKGYGLKVNSAPSVEQRFTGTGEGFGSVVAGRFQLLDGQNTITISQGWGYYGIDYILLTPVGGAPITPAPVVPLVNGRAEAELGVLSGVEVATTPAVAN